MLLGLFGAWVGACGGEGARLSVDLRTDYAPGLEFERVEVDIGGEWDTAIAMEGEDYLRGVRVADLRLPKGLQEGTVRLFTPSGVLLSSRRVRVMIEGRFGTTVTIDRNCEDVTCPMGDVRATSCLGGRCVNPLCRTGEEETCPDPICNADEDCPSTECAEGRCEGGVCLLEPNPARCDEGFYCAGTECRVRPRAEDAGVDGGGFDGGSELCGMPCEVTDLPCALGEFACRDGEVACEAVGPRPTTHVCRPSAGACDPEERCDGTSLDCPANVLSTSVCRPSRGACDPAERCTGSSATCPADRLADDGTVCRAAASACDVAEACSGSTMCPIDEFQPFGTACPIGVCDGLGSCGVDCDEGAPCSTGRICELGVQSCADMACVPAGPAPPDTVCRAATGLCDRAETCGGETTCPDNSLIAAGVQCRAATGPCDVAEVCSGTSPTCPPDLSRPDGTPCGVSSGCGPAGMCTAASCAPGSGATCAVSLQFDGVDDRAVMGVGVSDEVTFEIFAELSDGGGAVMSIPGGWGVDVRPASVRGYEVFVSSVLDGCGPLSLGTFDVMGTWTHIALWVDHGAARVTAIVDGVQLRSANVELGVSVDGSLVLGADDACVDAAASYVGLLANLRVWNRLVPVGELRENSTGEDPAVLSGLTHWYRIDENSGQRLFDEVGGSTGTRGRDGTPAADDPRWVPGG